MLIARPRGHAQLGLWPWRGVSGVFGTNAGGISYQALTADAGIAQLGSGAIAKDERLAIYTCRDSSCVKISSDCDIVACTFLMSSYSHLVMLIARICHSLREA